MSIIESAVGIGEALKNLLGSTIKEMIEVEMDERWDMRNLSF